MPHLNDTGWGLLKPSSEASAPIAPFVPVVLVIFFVYLFRKDKMLINLAWIH